MNVCACTCVNGYFDSFQVVDGLYFDLRSVIRSICRLFVSMPQLSGSCGHQPAILIDKVTGLGWN